MQVLAVTDALLDGIPKDKILRDYEVWRGQVILKDSPRDTKKLRVALVGVYRIQCGISTYAEALFPEIAKHVGEYKIFAEYADAPEEPNALRCWKRGSSLQGLIAEIHKYDPDVVLVQHEYGIFPVARFWLSFMSEMQRYKTIVTLHSIYRHADKTVCEAVIKDIIVHTDAGRRILVDEKKVPGKVHTVAHFCYLSKSDTKLWNIYQSEHTIMQFGFGFKYKGWEQAIEVVAKLKPEYPDIFFTGLFSESSFNRVMHDQYYQSLMKSIHDKDLTDNVALIRGFQSEESLSSFLRTNQVAIFPYIDNGIHTVFGCSGAARLAMTAGIPIVVSDVPLFDDLEGVVPRAKSVDDVCEWVRKIFSDKAYMKTQVGSQNAFLAVNSLENVAKKYIDVMSNK